MKTTYKLIVIFIVSMLAFVGTVILSAKDKPFVDCSLTDYSVQVFCQTNDYRISKGLSELTYSPQAERVAEARAKHLCDSATFTHDGWLNFVDFDYHKVGENLAKGFVTPQEATQALIDSPTHLANITGKYDALGVYTSPCDGKFITVQVFIAE